MEKNGLGVGKKIAIVALTFALPIAVLCYLVLKNINEQIDFAALEKVGNTYQRPLEALLDHVQTYQIDSLSGKNNIELNVVKEKIEADFKALEQVNKISGSDLQFTAEGLGKRKRDNATYEKLKASWDAILSEKASPSQVKTKLDDSITTIRTMITHMGDTSNLILDPDLDSYYLMDVTLLALPQTQQRIGDMVNYATEVLKSNNISIEQRLKFAVQAALLKEADMDRVAGSAQTSLNEDANFYGTSPSLQKNLPPLMEAYAVTAKKFQEMNEALSKENANISLQDYIAAGLAARNASFDLWNASVAELDVLLQARIESYEHRKTMSFILSGLALLIACIISYLVASSIVKPLNKLVNLLGPGATLLGQSVKKITKVNSEKADPEMVGMICEELDAHADDMRKTVRDLEKVVHGHAVTKLADKK